MAASKLSKRTLPVQPSLDGVPAFGSISFSHPSAIKAGEGFFLSDGYKTALFVFSPDAADAPWDPTLTVPAYRIYTDPKHSLVEFFQYVNMTLFKALKELGLKLTFTGLQPEGHFYFIHKEIGTVGNESIEPTSDGDLGFSVDGMRGGSHEPTEAIEFTCRALPTKYVEYFVDGTRLAAGDVVKYQTDLYQTDYLDKIDTILMGEVTGRWSIEDIVVCPVS